jgi:undecaprenyl-diphosphatase
MADKAAANSAAQVAAPAGPSKLTIVLGFLAIGGCLVLLGVIADGVKTQEADALDAIATPLVHQFASPTLDAFMGDVTALGSNQGLVVLWAVAVIALVILRRRRDAALLTVALGGSVALNALMKAFFERPRPQLAWAHVLPDFSFPSGHSMDSVVFYFALALLVWQIAGRGPGFAAAVAAFVLVLLIGLSRIYLGYHYFTDVLGGYIAGVLWLVVVVSAFSGPERIRAWRDVRQAAAARS